MRRIRILQLAATVGLLAIPGTPAGAEDRDISRDTVAPDDGWAAYGTGTTGGSAADDTHVHTVTDRAGLVRALDGGSDTPKIIKIAGTIDANTDDDGHRLDCAAIYDAYNSGSERDLTADVGWTPTLHTKIDSAAVADREVARGAGAGRIP